MNRRKNIFVTKRGCWPARTFGIFCAVVVAFAGCGSDESVDTKHVCEPGATQSCISDNNTGQCNGAQACAADGRGWGACNCGGGTGGTTADASSGGTPGSGGAGGSSATGGTGAAGSGNTGGAAGLSGGGSGGVAGEGAAGSGGAPAGGSAGTSEGGASGSSGGGTAGSSGTAGSGGAIGGAAGSGGAAGAGGSGGVTSSCAGLPGPTMVDMGGWCIDSTEVTQAQYDVFLKAKGTDTSGQPSNCATNTSYHPQSGVNCTTYPFDPINKPNRPIGCVNWCDALAYCTWAGKRLCGKIGGGALSATDVTNPATGEWAYACSNGGTTKYPYGDTYDVFACKGNTTPLGPVDVGTTPKCHGLAPPFSQVWDLVGNVGEWVDLSTGVYSYSVGEYGTPEEFSCLTVYKMNPPTNSVWEIGFRCCK